MPPNRFEIFVEPSYEGDPSTKLCACDDSETAVALADYFAGTNRSPVDVKYRVVDSDCGDTVYESVYRRSPS